jgi:beta-glucosidase
MITRSKKRGVSILMSFPLLALAALLLVPLTAAQAQQRPQLGESSIAEVVGAMTVEEKVKLMVGMGLNLAAMMPDTGALGQAMAAFAASLPAPPPEGLEVPDKVPGASGRTHAVPELGIPSLTLTDGPAGVRIAPTRPDSPDRAYYTTAFPVATLLASSWDTELLGTVGEAFGEELLEYGLDILLAPGMNIHRNPLGGRNFEYYSEDPLLSGRLAAAFVNGLESEGVGATLKHFAANNQEFNRQQLNTILSERALREIYLRGFEIAVREAQPWAVMSSYNLINGTWTPESRGLLTTILRDEWGFDGFVMTDWWGGNDPVAMMNAGNDVLMPGTEPQLDAITSAVANGTLSEVQLDENLARLLGVILQSPTFKGYEYSDRPDLAAHAEIARRAAAESMVLLENDGRALPLAPGATVALFGNTAYDLIAGGTGSGDVFSKPYVISLDAGMEQAGYVVEASLGEAYRTHMAEWREEHPAPAMPFLPTPPIPEMPMDADRVAPLARTADVAVVTLGRQAGEGSDRQVDDFPLTEEERALIGSVSAAFHAAGKKVIVVMNVAGVIDVASWRDDVDAILFAWQPGQEGGHAIADVLRGAVNPSGRLPMTIPLTYADVPSAANFPGEVLPGQEETGTPVITGGGRPSRVTYEEGIYVGYRYYSTFGVEPAYPFGYGLSYTEFTYSDLQLSAPRFDGAMTVTVRVTNTGDIAGREVVQLYLSAPDGVLEKPERELRAFAKTGLLQPGASETVSFSLTGRDLTSFDPDRADWVAEPGTYEVRIGASAADMRLVGSFDLLEELVVEHAHNVLAPEVLIQELSQRGR